MSETHRIRSRKFPAAAGAGLALFLLFLGLVRSLPKIDILRGFGVRICVRDWSEGSATHVVAPFCDFAIAALRHSAQVIHQ